MRNYDRYQSTSKPPLILWGKRKREGINSQQGHQSQVTNRLTNGNHVIFLDKNCPYFCFSFSAQLVRLCDNRDFHDPLPQLVTFPLFSPSVKTKEKLKRLLHMDCVQSRLLYAAWKTFSGWFLWFTSIDNYFQTSSLSLKRKQNETLDRVSKYIQAPSDFMREEKMEGVTSQQSHHSQVIQSNLVKVHKP